jgi:hypothetical protein
MNCYAIRDISIDRARNATVTFWESIDSWLSRCFQAQSTIFGSMTREWLVSEAAGTMKSSPTASPKAQFRGVFMFVVPMERLILQCAVTIQQNPHPCIIGKTSKLISR